MSRQSLDKKDVEKSYLDFLDNSFQWDSNSSNEEPIFDSKSEVLWSRERNIVISQNDFFRDFQNGFSDLTEGSTSTCSWHNDDFDMNSGNKVKASLEAIEDALYEQQQSALLNKTVFQECCDWSNKFPFFRLKGKQILDVGDHTLLFSSEQNLRSTPASSTLSLQVEGKKMAIHAPEKLSKKTTNEKTHNELNEPANYFEETLADDGEYEEECAFDTRDTCNRIPQCQLGEESASSNCFKLIEDKIIEKIALEIWPKVLTVLQKLDPEPNEDFQLPPIVSVKGPKQIFCRPRTEGTDAPDIPRLNSLLSISPKVLQNKPDYGSWRATQRSRPNSEIHLYPRNHSVPSLKHEAQNTSDFASYQVYNKQAQQAKIYGEKDLGTIPSLLPAVNEDIIEPTNVLKNISIGSELKQRSSIIEIKSPMKSECILPPIDKKYHVPPNAKLTQNLFTFFGPPLKSDNHPSTRPATRPTTRPNTSAFRKNFKYSANLKNKSTNEGLSSLSQSNQVDHKRYDEMSLEKPVTLFPIVTSLVPLIERNSTSGKKSVLNTFSGDRKR
ncbi:hypothetical protein JTE90_013759 [Oedothorax gibbosus]|uniref:DUF3719 domain-containing protein n=1 Tax=Oedothorax gibbosus TaxID=931172 RepID=A0AAV6V088_9ARAC|nr:hypothetical protein JTE90_013759 [Oedothorax gibbosus]